MLQHITTRWPNARNMLRQQCCDMLRSHVAIVWPGLYTNPDYNLGLIKVIPLKLF